MKYHSAEGSWGPRGRGRRRGGARSSPIAAHAAAGHAPAAGPGVLVDTTLCVGCRACEARLLGGEPLPPPEEDGARLLAAPRRRR